MSESTGMVKSIINLLKPKSKSELYDFEYESIMEHLSSKEHLLNELMNDMWYSGDLPSVRNCNEPPSLIDSKLVLREQICVWSALEYDLTPNQKKLNEELFKTLKRLTSYYSSFDNIEPFEEFLHNNRNNKDLKVILNLRRGTSESTVLHAIAGAKIDEYRPLGDRAIDLLLDAGADPNIKNNAGKTPLHLAVAAGYGCNVDSLLSKGANPSIANRKGKTPQQIAVNNHRYDIEALFLTDKQKELMRKLYDLDRFDSNYTKNLKKFLGEHEGDLDLKVVLNIRDAGGKSKLFSHLDDCWDNEDGMKETKKILLKMGVLDDRVNIDYPHKKKEQISTLLVKLTLQQEEELLKSLFDKVFNVQNMVELEKTVNGAIKSGVRLNYSFSRDFFSGNEYTFTDYVIKKISELEKNPKVASSIICKLVSKGAVFGNTADTNMINTLTSKFKEHKTNLKKAYIDYVSNSYKFIEVAKSATNSELKDARVDNSVFYLEYSKDSKIDIIKITDGARDLSLTDGDVKCGRNIVKIGKSEVEIKIEDGIRNYTDLTEGSSIVLTFYTSLGELEVRLYPDEKNENWVKVEVSEEGLLLLDEIDSYNEAIEDCNEGIENYEKIGQNCLLGGLSVIEAIDRGVFARSGGLVRPEVISGSNNKWTEREELRRTSDPKREVSR